MGTPCENAHIAWKKVSKFGITKKLKANKNSKWETA